MVMVLGARRVKWSDQPYPHAEPASGPGRGMVIIAQGPREFKILK
jgi:hypothetical protein